MYYPVFDEFAELARKGNLIPVYREILADLETPVSAFLKISDRRYSYLLESVEGGEKWARYTFLGTNPAMVLQTRGNMVEVRGHGKTRRIPVGSNPLQVLKDIMAGYRPVLVKGLPRFSGGAVGYLSYDIVSYFEDILPRPKKGLNFPDLFFMITDTLLIFDNVSQRIKVVSNAHVSRGDVKGAYKRAKDKIDRVIKRLREARVKLPKVSGNGAALKGGLSSNMSKEEFLDMVIKAKEYIRAGDIFQVVLSQRSERKVRSHPFNIYRVLRTINPSPYMFYLNLGDFHMVGASPEVLVRCEDGVVEVRPIAGTRRRGEGEEEDRALQEELLSDTKERAEHIMLVDLGRNDVGKVSDTGTVSVNELMVTEKYSHVMHLVSNVRGRLQKGKDVYDVIRSCFPAGTVSGAPKIRAMQIIEESEPTRRGPYAGAVGYFSFLGNMDTCINIRSIIIKGNNAYIQAGAGIVADSEPEKEYIETVNKAKAMMMAIEMAESGVLDI